MPPPSFNGLTVLLLESRRSREMAALVTSHGGRPVEAPSMREVPLETNTEAVEFADRLIRGEFDIVVLLTGVGTRALLETVERVRGSRDEFVAALARTRIVARGPKPVAVLRELKLTPWVTAPEPNTWREVLSSLDAVEADLQARPAPISTVEADLQARPTPISTVEADLQARPAPTSTVEADLQVRPAPMSTVEADLQVRPEHRPLNGVRIAVQEYGSSNPDLLAGLEARGAKVTRVPVYQWALPDDLGPLQNGIRMLTAGEIDVVMFTTATQVVHLLQVAETMGVAEAVREALSRTVVASIGPTTSEELRQQGIEIDMEPSHPKMGFLVREAAERAAGLLSQKRSR